MDSTKALTRKAVAAAIFDPGATEGFKGDRTLTEWQTDAVMRALAEQGEAPQPIGSDTCLLDGRAMVPQLGGHERDLQNVLRSVLYHYGPEGAHKITSDALAARPKSGSDQ